MAEELTEDKLVPLGKLGPIQRSLLRLFGLDQWRYGPRTTPSTTARDATLLRREQMSMLMGEFSAYTQLSSDRRVKYADYDAMDEGNPIIANALSLVAQEATPEDSRKKKVLWIASKDPSVEKLLHRFLSEIHLEERAWGSTRNLAKYGDVFHLQLFDYKEAKGEEKEILRFKSLQYIYPGRVDRIEDDELIGYRSPDLATIIPPGNSDGIYAPWNFTHGRVMSYDSESIYGRSFIEEVRKIYKMLQILETMVALAHVQRAVERHIFTIDVGNASEEEALGLVKKWKQWLRRKEYFDPTTQQFKADFNPNTIQEDIFMPKRTGSETKVDTLPSRVPPQGLVDDLNYFRNNLCAGLGIPRDYLDGVTQGAWDSKAALVIQDIHFARKIERLQRGFREMVKRICQVRLALEGKGEIPDFDVRMAGLSVISDRLNEDLWQRRAEVMSALVALADSMGWDKEAWSKHVTSTFLHDVPEETLEKLLNSIRNNLLQQRTGMGADGKNGDDPTKHDPSNPVSPELPKKMPRDEFPAGIKSLFADALGEEAADAMEESGTHDADAKNLKRLKADLSAMKEKIITSYPQLRNFAKAAVKGLKETENKKEAN